MALCRSHRISSVFRDGSFNNSVCLSYVKDYKSAIKDHLVVTLYCGLCCSCLEQLWLDQWLLKYVTDSDVATVHWFWQLQESGTSTLLVKKKAAWLRFHPSIQGIQEKGWAATHQRIKVAISNSLVYRTEYILQYSSVIIIKMYHDCLNYFSIAIKTQRPRQLTERFI